MNDIGAMNNLMGAGMTRVQNPQRPVSPAEANPAAASGAVAASGNAQAAQGLGNEQLSISPAAYRLSQTEATGPAAESAMDAGQAQTMAQRIQSAMREDPQAALAVQSGRLNAQRVAALLN